MSPEPVDRLMNKSIYLHASDNISKYLVRINNYVTDIQYR